MATGKKFVLGTDVILEAGSEAIKEMKPSNDSLKNEIHFDFRALEPYRDDPNVIEFLRDVNKKSTKDSSIEIVSSVPRENLEEYEVVTDDPFLEREMIKDGFQYSSRPRFLLENPDTLKKGIIKTTTKDKFNDLKDGYDLEDAIDRFSINKGDLFPNQFYIVSCNGGAEALYQVKQDWEIDSKGNLVFSGDPQMRRLEKEVTYFSKENPFSDLELDFGIRPNHLNQYLAYHYLLRDPSIEFVSLSGEAGSGKTLLAYMAGLRQALVETGQEAEIKKGKVNSLYECIRLLKTSQGEKEHQLGFLPGDLGDKQGPLMKSFAHIHNYELQGIHFSYEDAKEPNNLQFYRSKAGGQKGSPALFPSRDSVPFVFEEAVEYIKGMTYRNSFMVVDEAQDARTRIAKSILTRVGKGSKLVMCGDPEQITTPGLLPDKNGLVYASVHHMRQHHPFFGMIHLPVSSRGNVAKASNYMPNRRD